MLEPHCVNELTYFIKLHEIETIDTRTIINEMMPKLYDYILAEELVEYPYTAPPAVTTANCSFYFNEDNVGEPRTDYRGGGVLIDSIES